MRPCQDFDRDVIRPPLLIPSNTLPPNLQIESVENYLFWVTCNYHLRVKSPVRTARSSVPDDIIRPVPVPEVSYTQIFGSSQKQNRWGIFLFCASCRRHN